MPIITGTSVDDTLTGTSNPDTIDGLAGNDTLSGGASTDTIYGRDGDDIIDGGTGNDSMLGGTGNDIFTVDSASDGVVEFTNEGTDEIRTALADYTLLLASNVENLTFTGPSGNFTGSGNTLDNIVSGGAGQDTLQGFDGHDRLIGAAGGDIIYGGTGNDYLDGGTGDDVMLGGAGNDIFIVDSQFDIPSEEPGEGDDELRTALAGYPLGNGIERLTYTGSADFLGYGNELDNIIVGGNGNDALHGEGGADRLEGGAGDDSYFVDDQDSVVETAGNGFDAIGTSLSSYSLATISNVEGLTYMGSGDFSGTGNALDNGIDGGAGNDTLVGLDGRDFLHGNGGNDVLDGGIGDDFMLGGAGNDTYFVDSSNDSIIEDPGKGNDEVRTSLSAYSLSGTLENLTYTGTGNFIGTGNSLDNVLAGGAGNDTIDGAGGNDTFVLAGRREDYQVTGNPDGSFTLVDQRGGSPDGTDTIRSVEQVSFSDDLVAAADLTNEAPFNALPASLSGAEDEAIFLSGGVFIDPTPTVVGDVDSATITSHLTVSDGLFAAVTSTAAVITGHGTSDLTVSGSVADVNYVLYTLAYVPAPDVNGTRIITVETSDGDLADTDTITLGLSAMPDAPAGIDQSFDLAEDGTRQLQAADFGFSDVDGDGMAEVLVAATPAHGTIHNAGGYVVMIDVDGDGSPELITTQSPFDYAAGQTIARAHLDGGYISYVPDPDYAGPDSFTFQVVDDSGAPYGFKVDPTPNTLNFNMTEINDVPELDLNGADPGTSNAITFAENQMATLLAPNSTLTDPDAVNYENGTLTVAIVAGGAFDDTLFVPSEEGALLVGDQVIGYASGGNGEPLVVTFTDQATVAIVEMVVKSVCFANYSDDPAEGLRTIEYVLTDGAGGTAATVSATVDVTAFEDGAVAYDDDVGTGDSVALEGSVFAENGGGMDYDPDGPAPVVTEVNGIAADVGSEILLASGAKLILNADGTFSYDPNHVFEYLISFEKAAQTFTFNGGPATDTFTYTITGGDTATVTIHIDAMDGPGDELRGDLNNNLLGTEGADLFVLTYLPDYTVSGLGGDDVFNFGNTFDASDQVDGGAGSDTILFEGDFLSSPLVLTPTTLVNVEAIVLGGSFSYNIMSVDETVGAGAVLRVDGSALVAPNGLYFAGGAETDGRFELIGGAGDDVLIGGGGNDLLVGGRGSDVFDGRLGTDRVDYSQATGTVTASLVGGHAFHGADVDDLFGIENLTGSAFDDVLTGSDSANVLDGAVGADVMIGLGGNDTYVVDNVGDVVTESDPLGGLDAVRSSVDYTLGSNVENLVLSGTANIKGTGNGQNNVLTGNSGNNILDGAGGADSMRGGLGNDVYVVSDAGDIAIETDPAGGLDTVRSALSITLGANLENLILTGTADINGTGNALNNTMTGNSGANLLNGVGGVDSLRGGDGDDIYVVGDVGDTVIETNALAAGGNDLVRSAISFQIGANIEALQLTGTGAINGTGNGLDNFLTGNNAANTLNGGAGADTMSGGLGDDLYFVDNVGDQAIELSAGGGIDTVQANASFVLGALVENLTLTGTGAIDGTGNAQANIINGNGSNNDLDGGAGDDVINAGNGADTLWGGLGIDTLNGSAGNDQLIGGLGNDILTSGSGVDELYFDTALSAFYNVDHITDFSSIGDTIYLNDAFFTGLAAGALSASAFRAGSAALDGDDRILYDAATGHILFDADGVGGTAAILFATVAPATIVTAADFIVF